MCYRLVEIKHNLKVKLFFCVTMYRSPGYILSLLLYSPGSTKIFKDIA